MNPYANRYRADHEVPHSAKLLQSKYFSKCRRCGGGIEPGTMIYWHPQAGVVHEHCPAKSASVEHSAPTVNAPIAHTPKAPAAVLSGDLKLDKGTFTAVFPDGSHATLRLKAHWDAVKAEQGERVLQYLTGSDNTADYTSFAFLDALGNARLFARFAENERLLEALRIVLHDPQAAAEGHALESGRCARCGRLLTVPASLHRGLGPECAQHWGVA